MAVLQWGLVCGDVVVDKSTNAVTYRDGIEQLSSSVYPATLPPVLKIATLWRRDEDGSPETTRVRVSALFEDGSELGVSDPVTVDLNGYERYRAHIANPEIEVPEAGTVWFNVQRETPEGWVNEKGIPVLFEEVEASTEGEPTE